MEAKRADGAVILPESVSTTLAGPEETRTPVLVHEDGTELAQLREGVLAQLSVLTSTGARQELPLEPLIRWLRENRPALLSSPYKPPAQWVEAAEAFWGAALAEETREAERYYLEVYAAWTHQRSGVTGQPLPPLAQCNALVRAGWLAVAREKARQISYYCVRVPSPLPNEATALLAEAKHTPGPSLLVPADSAADTALQTITEAMGWLLQGRPLSGAPTDFEALAYGQHLETGGTEASWDNLGTEGRKARAQWLEQVLTGERLRLGCWLGDLLTGRAAAPAAPGTEIPRAR